MSTLGAIRLAPFSGSVGDPPSLRDCMSYWHSFSQYTTLVPRYMSVDGSSNVTGHSDTQAVADAQISMAYANGIDYFAFSLCNSQYQFLSSGIGFHPTPLHQFWDEFNNELVLHRSSTLKSLMKYCVITGAWGPVLPVLDDDSSWDTYLNPYLVTMFQDPDYMTVLGGRPLLYMFNNGVATDFGIYEGVGFSGNAAEAAAIQDLRDRCVIAGVSDPYIVSLGTSTTVPQDLAAFGVDAGGIYGIDATSAAQTFSSFKTLVEGTWPSLTSWYGTDQVVTVQTGYDHNRITADHSGIALDRDGNDTFWTPDNASGGGYSEPLLSRYSLAPTVTQWLAHVQAGKARAAANSDADTLLLSSWVEADVCPPLVPTWGGPEYLTSTAQELGRQRESRRILSARGIAYNSR